MGTLTAQLTNTKHAALLLIRNTIKENGGQVVFYLEEEAFQNERLTNTFISKTIELIINTAYTDNHELYPLSIIGNDVSCILNCIDEEGDTFVVDVLEDADDYTLTMLADFMSPKNHPAISTCNEAHLLLKRALMAFKHIPNKSFNGRADNTYQLAADISRYFNTLK